MKRSGYHQNPGGMAEIEEQSRNKGYTKTSQEGYLSRRDAIGCPAGNRSPNRHGQPEGHEEDGEPHLHIVFRDIGAVDEGEREDRNDGPVKEAICKRGDECCEADETGGGSDVEPCRRFGCIPVSQRGEEHPCCAGHEELWASLHLYSVL